MSDNKKRKVPPTVLRALRFALSHAQMEGCGVAKEHQEAMRLYLQTWCAGPLKEVIAWANGYVQASEMVKW